MSGFRIPFFRPSITEDDINAAAGSIRSGWVTTGPNAKAFEEELSAYCGAEYVNAVNSCTAALHLALRGWRIGPGDEVITTPYTFVATVTTILHTGATPVFVDVCDDDANINPNMIESAITPQTRAIVPVHFAGLSCDMDKIMDVARANGVKVLEDAAHAIGASYRGRKIGAIGDATAFSFYATKNLTTGEGGALATDDQELSERVRMLTLHGMTRDAWGRYDAGGSWRYDVEELGFKDNLTDYAAALGRRQLLRLDEMTVRRTKIAHRYLNNLAEEEHLILPAGANAEGHAWHLFMIRLRDGAPIDRESLIRGLSERGIGTSVHFIPVHTFSVFRRMERWSNGDFPVAERIFSGAVSLPLFPDMTEAEVDEVCEVVRVLLRGS